MKGNIYIKGNLYTNHPMDGRQLMKDGITFHIKKDTFFHENKDDLQLDENDVFIDDIFTNFDVKDIIVFDKF